MSLDSSIHTLNILEVFAKNNFFMWLVYYRFLFFFLLISKMIFICKFLWANADLHILGI